MNKAILIGRVGNDPEIKELESGVKVVNFSLATSERYKDRDGNQVDKTEWHRCTAWRKTADLIEQYVYKGDRLAVEGKIQTRQYDVDGATKYTTEIIVDRIEFLGGKTDQDQAEPEADKDTGEIKDKPDLDKDIKKDDLPF